MIRLNILLMTLFLLTSCTDSDLIPKSQRADTSLSSSASSSDDQNNILLLDNTLVSNIGRTASEIATNYSEWTFLGCINGWNYFQDTQQEQPLVFLFDYLDDDDQVVETVRFDSICRGISTTLSVFIPNLNDENSVITQDMLEQYLGIDLKWSSEEENGDTDYFYSAISGTDFVVLIYPDSKSNISPDSAISIIESE